MAPSVQSFRRGMLQSRLLCLSLLIILAQGTIVLAQNAPSPDTSDVVKFDGRWVTRAERDQIIGRQKRLTHVCAALGVRKEDCNTVSLESSGQREKNPQFQQLIDGLKKYVEGDFGDASLKLNQYLTYRPDDCTALRFFGLSCRKMASELEIQSKASSGATADVETKQNKRKKYLVDAENALGKRTRLSPDSAEAWNDLGEFVFELDRFADAHKCFQRALLKQPDFAVARINLARLYMEAGLPLEAKSMLDGVAGATPPEPEFAELQQRIRKAAEEYERQRKLQEEFGRNLSSGLEMYHGRWMRADEKRTLIEIEITHVQVLLDEAHARHKTSSPEEIALLFRQTQQFVEKYDADESIDEHIQEKTLLLLSFLYISADRVAKGMKQELEEMNDSFGLPEKHRRLEAFSTDVYIPLMELLSRHIGAYVSLHGKENLDKLFRDNDLGDLLQRLE